MNRSNRGIVLSLAFVIGTISFALLGIGTNTQEKGNVVMPKPNMNPPDYDHPPKKAFDRSDNFFTFDQLDEAFRFPGEYTHRLDGAKYGFESLSFIITDTQPNGGPNLHVHDFEEAHVLLEGTAEYRIGDKTFTVKGPYVVKVPAGVPHTFVNVGTEPFKLVAAFASPHLASKRLGPNPLIKSTKKK